ncbi:AraC-type transcriptional regulator domain protein [Solidesulfovibrio carbinoliphilus subsp. oakridgensis]|uniref:AraC-type transcriptional regulator domain protein n=1 Tax=Solidesulfovibrio carbinoliphilus subsp. oakridgensis TaxID=694327 RepID=G7QC01_9BACT|nr:AraC-type transcriptional regulator domain protein [Solidesulfovibrio carbinoliphilus subsp. oakridgensis]
MEHPDLLRPKSRMAALLAGLAARDGFTPTRLPDVQVVRNSHPFPRRPVVYSPGIVIVGQGKSTATSGTRSTPTTRTTTSSPRSSCPSSAR